MCYKKECGCEFSDKRELGHISKEPTLEIYCNKQCGYHRGRSDEKKEQDSAKDNPANTTFPCGHSKIEANADGQCSRCILIKSLEIYRNKQGHTCGCTFEPIDLGRIPSTRYFVKRCEYHQGYEAAEKSCKEVIDAWQKSAVKLQKQVDELDQRLKDSYKIKQQLALQNNHFKNNVESLKSEVERLEKELAAKPDWPKDPVILVAALDNGQLLNVKLSFDLK